MGVAPAGYQRVATALLHTFDETGLGQVVDEARGSPSVDVERLAQGGLDAAGLLVDVLTDQGYVREILAAGRHVLSPRLKRLVRLDERGNRVQGPFIPQYGGQGATIFDGRDKTEVEAPILTGRLADNVRDAGDVS